MYYAHRTKSEDKATWQLLIVHLQEVAELAGHFAAAFGARDWGKAAGILHDLGKYSKKFQLRLAGSQIAVDHATAGAQHMMEREKGDYALLLAYIIAGHHAGLPDCGTDAGEESTLFNRLKKEVEPYQEAAFNELPQQLGLNKLSLSLKPGISPEFQLAFFTRMIFSCLIDADSLNSEAFSNQKQSAKRGKIADFPKLFKKFETYIQDEFGVPKSSININRLELLTHCITRAQSPRGMKTLTLPTGSGKTLISLGYALRHAIHHSTNDDQGIRRIIYVIPYTSIIEQNARIFRKIVGSKNVLEHHSNVQHEKKQESEDGSVDLKEKLQLAEENWDYPIIVTTNVQFFESLFANKRARCRKLHNLANSIIILDEAQLMNGGLFKPSLYALQELTQNYGATVLLCTATQPEIEKLFPEPIQIEELTDDVPLRFEQFKRVRIKQVGTLSLNQIDEQLASHKQVLCVVNTRKIAREIYAQCLKRSSEDAMKEGFFHLSARMCPIHRTETLALIQERLDDKKNLPCTVISTQLIEAGVDIDFPAVYREMAGLDSIAQAAGRCNRNGKALLGYTYVFETEYGLPPGWFSATAEVTQSVLEKYKDDPLSLEAVRKYFNELYFYQSSGKVDKTDSKGILELIERRGALLEFPFREIAQRFQLIETAAKAVIVPYERCEERDEKKDNALDDGVYIDEHGHKQGGRNNSKAWKLIDQLQFAFPMTSILRQLQPYVVQLYPNEFNAFQKAGEIEQVREGVWVLKNPAKWYDDKLGVIPYSQQFHEDEIYIF
ncbi:hypothetical protein BBD42_29445 [Paenibacillus sp. BIHB 4019]|uniref:CRISPR-associated helicase/endonuclease Cas3 n=1 Tax=Paenibacillus sp. BIHB 4019 TaxID=1870819 RepID=A0A1B2DR33_9BACL|nr:CRISPR-associated helicase/endonuclease Cas3 [Paenibacillus sp. BIHB 4019]ANY70169.1 hypothetical protein BBD42_29445 [Paenibacillus sp. BIHB 4019]